MEVEYTKCTCKCCEEKDMEIALLKDGMYAAMEQTCLKLEAENKKLRALVERGAGFGEMEPWGIVELFGEDCREALK